MYSYSSAQGNTVSPCPCGVFHPYNGHCSYYNSSSYSYADNSSAVDCTLSLGTPSTRRTSAAEPHRSSSSGNRLSNFCWDFLHQTTNSKHSSTKHNSSSHRPNPAVPAAAADPMLSRRCANCDTTSTPLWRNGPRGPKSLCNACGIRYKKEERRATAAASNHSNPMMESHVGNGGYNYWGSHHQGHQKELRFVDDVVSGDSDSGSMQFLSWRLNLTDRPTSQLVYDFTR